MPASPAGTCCTASVEAVAEKVKKTEDQWREELSPEQYEVLRKGGTERAFTGQYWNVKQDGMYRCAGCGAELFSSDTKFDSGTGWPSFYQPIDKTEVVEKSDKSHGSERIVLVHHGHAEDRHDGVADELLDGSPVVVDHRAHLLEVAPHDRSQ